MNDSGASLSVGEKQLLAICRAVLRKNKIVIMDEATANIDIVTEEKIQKLMNSAFKDSTVITIAHRLNTVMGGDRVLVLDKGQMLEYDEPSKLASNPKSRLYEMLSEIKKD
jgi:ATP-binding cassette subfamily C (CFTR/MRP) protein 1